MRSSVKSCCKKSRVNDAELPNYILILVSEGTGYEDSLLEVFLHLVQPCTLGQHMIAL